MLEYIMNIKKNGIKNKIITIVGAFQTNTGYGEYARNIGKMVLQLYEENNMVLLVNVAQNMINKFDFKNSQYEILEQNIVSYNTNLKSDINIIVGIPNSFAKLRLGQINIGVTALAQSTIVNPNLLNHMAGLDKVFVMSEFNLQTINRTIQSYKIQNFNIPIGVLPYVVQDVQFEQDSEIKKRMNSLSKGNYFIFNGNWLPGNIREDRKNVGMLIKQFIQKYNSSNIGLILKLSLGNDNRLTEFQMVHRISQIKRILNCQNVDNIQLILGNLSDKQLYNIYNHPKVISYISFTHGESCGIPIVQFSAWTGKPVLVPKWSGYMDYLKEQLNLFFDGNLIPVPRHLLISQFKEYFVDRSMWFEMDYNSVVINCNLMLSDFKSITQKSKIQKKYILDNFGLEKGKGIISSTIEELINLKDKKV